MTTWTLTLTLTVWQGPSPPWTEPPPPPHLLLDVGVSMQHKSRRAAIRLRLQGDVDAEHNGAQLVPEVRLVLGRGQESGHRATVFPTADAPRPQRPAGAQGRTSSSHPQPRPCPARTRRKAVVVWQMGLSLPPRSRCRVVPACWEFSSSTLRPWRGFCRSSCSSAFRPGGAGREGQGLPGQPPGAPGRLPPVPTLPLTQLLRNIVSGGSDTHLDVKAAKR